MKNFQIEKRIFKRHKIRKPVSIIEASIPDQPTHLVLDDLSGGGALVHTSAEIPNGTRFKMLVELPFPRKWFGVKQVKFLVSGKVIRMDGPFSVAVQFDDSNMIQTKPGN